LQHSERPTPCGQSASLLLCVCCVGGRTDDSSSASRDEGPHAVHNQGKRLHRCATPTRLLPLPDPLRLVLVASVTHDRLPGCTAVRCASAGSPHRDGCPTAIAPDPCAGRRVWRSDPPLGSRRWVIVRVSSRRSVRTCGVGWVDLCKGGEGPWEGVQHRDDDVMMTMCIEAFTARVLPGLRAQGGALAAGAIPLVSHVSCCGGWMRADA